MKILLVGCFIFVDIVSGCVNGFKNKTFDSARLRQGLWHKGGFILALVTSALIDLAQGYYDLGFTLPILGAVSVYIILTEITSIYENLCGICPELKNKKFSQFFKKAQK